MCVLWILIGNCIVGVYYIHYMAILKRVMY